MRYALVTGSKAQIAPYLPENYSALVERTDERGRPTTLIGGQDDRGWTLDGYVLPRLASGLYFGGEVDAVEAASLGKEES